MVRGIIDFVHNKENFNSLNSYIRFTTRFLEYIEANKQATIVSQNETDYNFYQFNNEADFRITRPFNSAILYSSEEFAEKAEEFLEIIEMLKSDKENAIITNPEVINRTIYTMQQTVGFALDASPETNRARKLNGDYFELLILYLFGELGLDSTHGTVKVPVKVDGEELFKMSYQHDLIVRNEETGAKEIDNVKIIGSVKTTSKDRIGKIFIDKFMFSQLTESEIPHIAIFLHDVQRKKTRNPHQYSVNGTFLTNHFKGYTIKLNPLDGVYYFDPRPNMQSDIFLSERIHTFDKLICKDVWKMLE